MKPRTLAVVAYAAVTLAGLLLTALIEPSKKRKRASVDPEPPPEPSPEPSPELFSPEQVSPLSLEAGSNKV